MCSRSTPVCLREEIVPICVLGEYCVWYGCCIAEAVLLVHDSLSVDTVFIELLICNNILIA